MTSEPPDPPIWLRPEPGARRPRFTRERIAAAALELADREGIEAVSMRRVAAALGAGTMTLYHYVGTKDDLLSLMDDAIMAEVVVPDEQLPRDDWRAAMAVIARSSRDAFLRHPWAMEGLRGVRFGPNGMRHFEQSLLAAEATGLPPRERLSLLAVVDDYVFGYIARNQDDPERTTADGTWDDASVLEWFGGMIDSGDFPALRRLLGDDDRRARWADLAAGWTDRFEHGLQIVLDGIALELERHRAG